MFCLDCCSDTEGFLLFWCRLLRFLVFQKWRSRIHESCSQVTCTLPGLFSHLSKRYLSIFSCLSFFCTVWECMYVDVAILQLKWLNQELTKIWPFVNEVCISCNWTPKSAFNWISVWLDFFMYIFIMCAFLFWSLAIAGSIRTDQNICWACSWAIQANNLGLSEVLKTHSWYCCTTVYR